MTTSIWGSTLGLPHLSVEKGIITGWIISLSLFSLAMNMLVKSVEPKCQGPLTRSGVRQPPIRAFMDEMVPPGFEETNHLGPDVFQASKVQVSGNQEKECDRPAQPSQKSRRALGKHTTAFWKTLPQSGLVTRTWKDGWWLSKNQHSQVNSKPGYTRMASYPAFCGHCWYMNSHCQLWKALKWGSAGT